MALRLTEGLGVTVQIHQGELGLNPDCSCLRTCIEADGHDAELARGRAVRVATT
jgi:hypothetical protein